MMTTLSLARNTCRSSLWKSLISKSQISRNGLGTSLMHREIAKIRRMPAALLSTSQTVHEASTHDHSHTKVWTAERFLSAGLIGILPVALAFPNPMLDYSLALALTVHVHWGVEAIVVDYIRPSIVGATLAKVAVAAVYGLSVFTLGGLFYFNYSDVGLSQAIRMLWKL